MGDKDYNLGYENLKLLLMYFIGPGKIKNHDNLGL